MLAASGGLMLPSGLLGLFIVRFDPSDGSSFATLSVSFNPPF